jgi:hypothetical protein
MTTGSTPSTSSATLAPSSISRARPAAPKLHQLLRRRLEEIPDLTNVAIARALDYPQPNVIAMILKGKMKLPVAKVPAMARVLEVDPVWLLRVTLREYEPAVLEVLATVMGRDPLLTKRELALIERVRDQSMDTDPDLLANAAFATALAASCAP